MRSLLTIAAIFTVLSMSSCVTKKNYQALESQLSRANSDLKNCNDIKDKLTSRLSSCENDLAMSRTSLGGKQDQFTQLKEQLADCQKQRDKQLSQVGDLTVLSKGANDNIGKTLAQLQDKDKYIQMLLAAKDKADSINLALAVNLKGVLKDGLDDKDVDIKVDKTVVYINLSDKMLYNSGKYTITDKAKAVLGKIASIVASRPEVDVMVEGYTDNNPIKTNCIDDNWDLSVKRSTSVVRVLQNDYHIDPNKLIAAGRGEYNQLVPNDNAEDMATNRRTRIIILPRLNQFYDLLDPTKAASKVK
ncbi:MAG: OmpA/MotB domain protein [Bacteroidetes bacterium]|nr:OmpA/MotB domain protein [Bacteroidota bacterium]